MVRVRLREVCSLFLLLLRFAVLSQAEPVSSSPREDKMGNKEITPLTTVVAQTPKDEKEDPLTPLPSVCDFEMKDDNVYGPLVPCEYLDEAFVECAEPKQAIPASPNSTKAVPGCSRFGGQRYENVERTNVTCHVLPCIECRGPRSFEREVPCIKHTGHHFLSTLLYSIFLGVLAVDRFCLGYSAIAVGKLMTLGGLGVWWIVDIVLLVTGNLTPSDDSNWEPYF